jgi:glucosylceramidase
MSPAWDALDCRPMKRFFACLLAFTSTAAACSASRDTAPPAVTADPSAPEAAPGPNDSAAPPVELPSTWIVTTARAAFARSTTTPVPESGQADVVVNTEHPLHEIHGFGGAFNEQGWSALGVLPEAERRAVMRALFDADEGLRFNYCRTPIGASDYALDRYTLDETPGDYAMAKFSIERDQKHLIPFIRAAREVRPDLKLWASAWTPPTWMKTNKSFDSGAMIDEPKNYAAYALYLSRYVESYASAGIPIEMVVPQNEPGQLTHYPSCDWTPAQYVTFIRDHLAPTLRARNLQTQIFVGTVNQDKWDVLSVLQDPGALAAISGAAFQWNALPHVAKVHAAFPNLSIMQSETECGNTRRMPDYDPETPPNNFAYAAYTFRKFRDFIQDGASSYMLWNMVLDEHGKNISSDKPWPQNAAVVVDRSTKQVTYTPMFWVTKHFSGLVDVGAHVLETRGAFADRIAFRNPDGTLVVELLNDTDAAKTLTVSANQRQHTLELPPQSFATLLIPEA